VTALARAVRDAASDTAGLKRQAMRIDPYTPLAAWPIPLRELDRALSSASSGLYRAANLASDAIGQNPPPGLSATPGSLAIASTRTSTAGDHANGAFEAIRRELRRTGTEPDISPSPLSRHAAYAAGQLSKLDDALLDDALLAAFRSDEPDLAVLAAVARHQSAILADLSATCDRFHYGVAEACDRIPKATSSKTARISGSLRRASVTLKKAAAGTAHAADALDDELTWGRRRGGAR
jgi:hypothetical protein